MPRVSEQYRKARRDEIALAAIRCLERKGVHDTSIADIVEESGLSTGAIYSHFSSKVELARYIVAEYLLPRLDYLRSTDDVRTPREVLTTMLGVFAEDGLPARIVLQFWGEATISGEMREEMLGTVGRLRAAMGAALRPWAQTQATDEAATESLVADSTRAVISLAQGYVASTALFGPRDAGEYVDSVAAALRQAPGDA
jgi:AcrR family transcriptional regulator